MVAQIEGNGEVGTVTGMMCTSYLRLAFRRRTG